MRLLVRLSVTFLLLLPLPVLAQTRAGVVAAPEVEKLMPGQVFFHSQSAPVQLRNSAAFRFSDGMLTLAGLVDTSGYSSAQQQTYQFYLLTDVPLTVSGQRIAPGAYGGGFVQGQGFLLQDLGGNVLFKTPTSHDAAMARPRPLLMQPGPTPDAAKLYLGRDFVTLERAH